MKKIVAFKKAGALLSLTASLLLFTGCELFGPKTEEPKTVTLQSITATPSSVTLEIGQASELIVLTGTYSDGTTKGLSGATWTSENTGTATVSAGVITGAAQGTTTVTAAKDGKSATVSVTVNAPSAAAPATLFKDQGLTYYVDKTDTPEDEVAMLQDMGGGGTFDLSKVPAKGTFGSYPSWWDGALGWVMKPTDASGLYDLTSVTKIRFKIKSADILPSELAYFIQWKSSTSGNGGEAAVSLEALGASALTDWVTLEVDLTSSGDIADAGDGRHAHTLENFHTGSGKSHVDTPFALKWEGSANAQPNSGPLSGGESYEIGDIEFLNASGENVNFYSGITWPEVTEPAAAPSAPALDGTETAFYTDSTGAAKTVSLRWASWSTAEKPELDLGGNKVKALPTSFVGYDVDPTDLTGLTTLHLSVWTQVHTALKIKLVDFLKDGWTDGGDKEFEYQATISTMGEWVNLSIPLSTWKDQGVPLSDLNQIILTGVDAAGTAGATYYIDNFYIK